MIRSPRPPALALGLAPRRPALPAAAERGDASTSTIAGIRVGAMTLERRAVGRRLHAPRAASTPPGSSACSPTSSSTARSTGQRRARRHGGAGRLTAPTSKSPRAPAHTEIDWKGGAPVEVSVEPPRKHARPTRRSRAARSTRSRPGFAAAPRPRRPTSVCDTTRRRLRRLAPVAAEARRRRGAGGDGIVCAGTYARIEGEAHSMAEPARVPVPAGLRAERRRRSAGSSGSRRRPTSATAVLERRG